MRVACFRARVGVREKTLVSYRLALVVPHAAFRFWAFLVCDAAARAGVVVGSERLLLVDGVCAVGALASR